MSAIYPHYYDPSVSMSRVEDEMPYQVKWFCEGLIIHVTYFGEITFKDIQKVNQEVPVLLASTEHSKVHYLLDISQVDNVPSHVSKYLTYARNTSAHLDIEWYVAHGVNNAILRVVLRLLAMIYGRKYHFAEDEQAAIEFLQSVEPRLAQDTGA